MAFLSVVAASFFKSYTPRITFYLLLCGMLPAIFNTPLKAQPVISLTVDDGLSQGYVSSITCDEDGFIWVATLNGLNRFDGYSFQTWNEQENGLNSNYVLHVRADDRGLIWIYTRKGLQVMNARTGDIRSLKCTEGMREGAYQSFLVDTRGWLWITADNRLYHIVLPEQWSSLDDISEPARLYPASIPPFFGKVTSITEFGQDLLLTTANGVYIYHPLADKYSFLKEFPAALAHSAWYDRAGGDLLVRYEDGLYALQKGMLRFWSMDRPVWNHNYNFIGNGRKLFIVTTSSIYEWQDGRPVMLSDGIGEEIISATADRFGQIWLGTNAKGLRIIRSQQHIFSTIMQGMSIGGVLFDSKGRLWYPKRENPEGLYYYLIDKKTGRLGKRFSENPYQGIAFLPDGSARAVNSRDEIELLRDDGTVVKGMEIKIPSGTFTNSTRNIGGLSSRNKLLLSDFAGTLALIDLSTKTVQRIQFDSVLQGNSGEVISIAEDRNGHFWLGTPSGLIRVSPADFKVSIIRTKGAPGKTLSSNKVNDVFIDPAEPDTLWAGTARGLNRVDIQSGAITAYTKKDGLNDDFIYTMRPGKAGDLWLGTNRGLICFNRATKQVIQYTVDDGLPASEFNTRMAWTDKDSTLYYGTVSGLIYFNPFKMPARPMSPDIRIIGLEVNGRTLHPADSSAGRQLVPYLDRLRLRPAENNLAFRFTVMDFFNREKYNCRYMLAGADKDWRYASSNNLITYANLAPGDYEFLVASGNGIGGWGPSRSLKIKILSPWWNRWWAWAIWLKLTLLIIWAVLRVRTRLTQMEMERLEAKHRADMEENKTRMFINIAHEVRTPLTILLGITDEISETTRPELKEKTDLMHKSGQQLLNVVQQILDLAKLEEHRLELNPHYGDLASFVRLTAEPFRPMLQSRNIEFIVYLPYKPVMMLFDPQYLQPVISNLLSNAAKFTAKGGIIALQLSQESPDKVSLSVEDTGIGIAPEYLSMIFDRYYQVESAYTKTSGTGIGLTYVSELVKAMGGEITVSSVPGVGSVFTLVLPVIKAGQDMQVQVWRQPPPAPAPEKEPEIFPKKSLGKPHVLLVEDNYEMAQFIGRALAQEYNTYHAFNGVEGLEMALSTVPDLIITDVMMPEMNGFAFCAAVKTHPITDHIPVIILTARAEDADRIQGLRQGADVYLAKPFSREVLRLHVRNLIASRSRMQRKLEAETGGEAPAETPETPETVFVAAVYRLIAEHYANPDFGVDDMCRHFNMSNSQFHRKVSALLAYTPGDVLRRYRLKQGKALLSGTGRLHISEVAYAIGFRDPNYFSQAFGRAYGQSPRQYRQSFENGEK